ncbi:GDSL-type esterase/lipase family protein [Actinophytocola oryzae]|uniref:Lysophospholipase L1-like esterase n=1 Tax=Actinophytocola oryzae TaxID=502181 RepID=A0A4R7W0V2_9PSEU|nr:GDSL-type esterase/lipase family protein [Actinophytocola oryzae]TDV56156.1 lysophospholipase L1-like esterase [Actinophytocola oryzae]
MTITNRVRRLLVLTVAFVAGVVAVSSVAGATPGRQGHRQWFTSWAQSQQWLSAAVLDHQSVRMITHLSQGGHALRIRLQNTFGTSPLSVDATTVAPSGGGPALTGPANAVTFHGRAAVVVPAGGDVWSDPVRLATRPQDDVAVSMYLAGRTTPGEHGSAFRNNYLTPTGSGDHTTDGDGAAYTATTGATYLVSAVDVANPDLDGTVVAFGSSVVDGTGSTDCGPGCTELGTNRRWTDDLARRVTTELPAGRQVAIANAGIGGTTSSAACPSIPGQFTGLDALARLDRDVLALHGVTAVLYYYGTNDLADACDARQILDSYRQVFARLRGAGVRVYVTPITPRPGYSDQNNLDRHAVGTFVENGNDCAGTCDGTVDFDRVLEDPLRPNSILPAYDVGDGIHVNIEAQQALADYVPLRMITNGPADR